MTAKEKLKEYGISYSIADNDLHYLSTSKCCCGDTLIHKAQISIIHQCSTNTE